MTSYSTYATSKLKIVDGTLASTFRSEPDADNDDLQNDLYLLAHAVASGAARALLDTCHDVTDAPDSSEQTEIHAEEWHSAEEGWELAALTDASREKLEQRALSFVTQNLPQVISLAERIAWDQRFKTETFAGDTGMGIYRVGMLLAYELAGEGIGFGDYWTPQDESAGDLSAARTLSRWADENADPAFEDAWIDSTEQPCLLHLTGH